MNTLFLLGLEAAPLIAQVVTVVIGFFITLWILKRFAWGPIIKVIDERRETIAREFESIESKQANLESQIRDYEERLRLIDNEARERMNKAIEEGRRSAAEIIEHARQEAEETKKKAGADIQLEIEKARVQLRDEVVKLTIQSTERLIKAELNDERRRALVTDFITELESRKAS